MRIPVFEVYKPACTILIAGLVLSACTPMGTPVIDTPEVVTATPQEPEPTVTTMPSLTPMPTRTKRPSATPSVTLTPGPSPTPAPTPRFGAGKVGSDFLFGNQPEGCELPCWQGLVIGKSDAEDAQRMFEEAFGFGGTNAARPEDLFVNVGVPGLLRLTHQWHFDSGFSFVSTLLQENTHVLEAVLLYGDADRFEPYTSPQNILRNMGVPSHILFRTQPAEVGGWYGSELLFSYEEGVTIRYPPFLSREISQASGITLELCLGNLSESYGTRIYITPPLVGNDMDTLFSPMRKR